MNRENEYEAFERLVKNKNFNQLNEEERFFVLQWVVEEDYENMHHLLAFMGAEGKSIQNEKSLFQATQIWDEAKSDIHLKQGLNKEKKRGKRMIPLWQAASFALLFGLCAWIIKPTIEVSFSPATKSNVVNAVFPETMDTLIYPKLVYIHDNSISQNEYILENASVQTSNSSNSVYVPDPDLVASMSASKTGTNVSELSGKKFITVQIP